MSSPRCPEQHYFAILGCEPRFPHTKSKAKPPERAKKVKKWLTKSPAHVIGGAEFAA
jgi:hypothetical protein